jgi:hypothetical protein
MGQGVYLRVPPLLIKEIRLIRKEEKKEAAADTVAERSLA